jgi:hypothetical protein
MQKQYFKIKISDLTDEVLDKSTSDNPYSAKRTLDGKYILLSYVQKSVPAYLLKLGYIPMNSDDARTELSSSEWYEEETTGSIINNGSLKDSNNSPIVRTHAFANTDNLRFRGTGMAGQCTKNTSTNVDFKMPR